MRYLVNQDIYEMRKSELKDITSSEEIPEKQKVLSYLKTFEKYAYTTVHVVDVFTEDELEIIDDAYSDGVYIWYESEIYHFEKYNLKLDDNFIQYVLSK